MNMPQVNAAMDEVHFLMDTTGMTYDGAVTTAAHDNGVPVPVLHAVAMYELYGVIVEIPA